MGIIQTETAQVESDFIEVPEEELLADDVEVSPEEGLEDYDPNESARDTVSRLVKEMQEGKSDGNQDGEAEKEAAPEASQNSAKQVRDARGKFQKAAPVDPVLDDDKFDPDLVAPQRLSPEAKAIFEKVPKELKREFSRSLKDLEAVTTKKSQEYSTAIGQIKGIVDIVQPFAPNWAKRGVSIPQGIGELCSFYANLSNPQTSTQEYVALGKKLGVNFDNLAEHARSGTTPVAQNNFAQNNSSSEEIRVLREQQNKLASLLQQQQINEQVKPIVNEMDAVRREIDPVSGQLRYPELHDGNYLLSLEPRVTELVGTIPGLSHADALKRANAERKQSLFGISTQPNQTRLQSANSTSVNNTQQRAVSAAVTVRGRTTPLSASISGAEPPPEALKDARSTTAWVLNQLRSGAAS